MTLPLTLAALILLAVAVLHFAGRRSRVPAQPVDRRLQLWARALSDRLPEAFDRIQLPTNVAKDGRERVSITSGRPIDGIGWQWRVQTPGAATIGHVRERMSQLESAVNRPTPLVAVMDVQPDPMHEGWGTLRAYRTDPIHAPRSIAEVCRPGERLMKSPTGTMLVGVTRWGAHTRLPLHKASMAVFGMTQRGKSSAVQTLLANVMPLVADGTARLRFIDVSVKQGRGYRWMRADGWFHSWATTPAEAFKVLADMQAELAARADDGNDTELRIDRSNPLDILIVEEGPAFLHCKQGNKSAADVLEDIARQVAAIGGVIVLVSQGAKEVPITLRRTLPTRVAFGLGDRTESGNAFDSASFEGGMPGPHSIPKTDGRNGTVDWRGVSYLDDDGRGVEMVRWWWVDPDWLRAHAAALRRVGAGR